MLYSNFYQWTSLLGSPFRGDAIALTVDGAASAFSICRMQSPSLGRRCWCRCCSRTPVQERTHASVPPTTPSTLNIWKCQKNSVSASVEITKTWKPMAGKCRRSDSASIAPSTGNTKKLLCSIILVFLEKSKSLHHRKPAKLSLKTPAASKRMLGGPGVGPPNAPKMKFKTVQIHTN